MLVPPLQAPPSPFACLAGHRASSLATPVATSVRPPFWLASPCAPSPGDGQTHQTTPRFSAASPSPRSVPQRGEDRPSSGPETKGPRTFASLALSPPTATSRHAVKERLSRRSLTTQRF